MSVKHTGKKAITTWVSEEDYYKFKFSAARKGQSNSERLAALVQADNESEDMAAMLGTRKVEEEEQAILKEKDATQKQMAYIELLSGIAGVKMPSKGMTISEANEYIQKLKREASHE